MKKIIAFITLTVFIISCDSLKKEVEQTLALTKSKFSYDKVNKVSISDVDITHLNSFSNISIVDIAKLTAAFTGGELPIHIDMNILAQTPNETTAKMNQMAWILNIDSTKMVDGIINEVYQIEGNEGSTDIPISTQMDLKKVLTGKSLEQMVNFVLNLVQSDSQPSTKMSLQVKPSIMIVSQSIAYPNYITVNY